MGSLSVRHRQLEIELGIELNDIKYSKLQELVAAGVGETSAMEFKLAPPLKAGTGGSPQAEHDPSKIDKWEFSKDIAALANAGGGAIFYGIAELSPHKATAGKIAPFKNLKDWVEAIEKAIALWVRPRPEFQVIPVYPHWESDEGIIIVAIGESAIFKRPFMNFSEQNHAKIAFPVRNGATEIRYMGEEEIELLYRERFRSSDERLARLTEVVSLGERHLDPIPGNCERVIWLCQAISPTYPASFPIDYSLMEVASKWTVGLGLLNYMRPHFSRRRVIFSDGQDGGSNSYSARFELHSDGSVFGDVPLYPEHFKERGMDQWRFQQLELEEKFFTFSIRSGNGLETLKLVANLGF